MIVFMDYMSLWFNFFNYFIQGTKAFCSGGDQALRSKDGYVDYDNFGRLNVLDLQESSKILKLNFICIICIKKLWNISEVQWIWFSHWLSSSVSKLRFSAHFLTGADSSITKASYCNGKQYFLDFLPNNIHQKCIHMNDLCLKTR